MISKLVFLCSKVIAQDCTDRQRTQLQYVLQVSLPTSVLSYLFSSLPVNRLINLQEDYPDSFSWEECWATLCYKHVQYCERLGIRSPLKDGGCSQTLDSKCAESFQRLCIALSSKDHECWWSWKEVFLNTYFEELIMSTFMLSRNSHPYAESQETAQKIFLKDLVGCSKHDISDKEMLLLSLKHITDLTITKSNVSHIQDLMKLSCSEKLKYLQLDNKCPQRRGANSADDWLFCINHVLQNSQLRELCTSNCTQILNHIAQIESSGRDVKSKSCVRGDVATSGDRFTNLKEDAAVACSPAPNSSRIIKLTLKYCVRHPFCLDSYKGLQCIHSLERLAVLCYSGEGGNLHLLNSIRKLLDSGLSHLKIVHFEIFCDFLQQFLLNCGLPEACSLGDEGISNGRIMKCCSTGVDCLLITGVCSESGGNLFKRMLPNFLRACNPAYLYIYLDGRGTEPILPYFSPSDPTPAKQKTPYRLQKITVVYRRYVNGQGGPQRVVSLSSLLSKIGFILKNIAKNIDLSLHCEVGQLPNNDSITSLFRNVEVTVLETLPSILES